MIRTIIDTYLKRKRSSGAFSPDTLRTRGSELSAFCEFCEKKSVKHCDSITIDVVVEYIGSRSLARTSLVTVTSRLQSFLDFAHAEGCMRKRIKLEKPKASAPTVDYLKPAELRKLFISASSHAGGNRNILLLALFSDLCLRASEVIGLRLKDVNLEALEIWITRKGGKVERIPINGGIAHLFKEWYRERKRQPNAGSEWVFISREGKLTKRMTHYIVAAALKKAGIKKRKNGPHMLRHSGASLKASAGENMVMIQFLLGHASLNTTQRYLHFDRDQLAGMVNRNSSILGEEK